MIEDVELREALARFLLSDAQHDGRTNIRPDEDLLATGVLDSLGIMQLMSFLEETTGVVLDADDIKPTNFQTIEALVRLVGTKRSA